MVRGPNLVPFGCTEKAKGVPSRFMSDGDGPTPLSSVSATTVDSAAAGAELASAAGIAVSADDEVPSWAAAMDTENSTVIMQPSRMRLALRMYQPLAVVLRHNDDVAIYQREVGLRIGAFERLLIVEVQTLLAAIALLPQDVNLVGFGVDAGPARLC